MDKEADLEDKITVRNEYENVLSMSERGIE